MKPRVESHIWTNVATGHKDRRWHVSFEDGCGCIEEEHFSSFTSAARFAYHLAMGGSHWEFSA